MLHARIASVSEESCSIHATESESAFTSILLMFIAVLRHAFYNARIYFIIHTEHLINDAVWDTLTDTAVDGALCYRSIAITALRSIRPSICEDKQASLSTIMKE